MAKKYADAIKAGTKVIEDVPARWREQVLALLGEDE